MNVHELHEMILSERDSLATHLRWTAERLRKTADQLEGETEPVSLFPQFNSLGELQNASMIESRCGKLGALIQVYMRMNPTRA